MKRAFLGITSCFIALLAFLSVLAAPVLAESAEESICKGTGGSWTFSKQTERYSCVQPGNSRTVPGTFNQISNILVFIVGAVSVIMIIVGGLRYTMAQGDQSAVTQAKNTILYAIIGLIVSITAYAIVNFVLKNI